MSEGLEIRQLSEADLAAMAEIHTASFETSWDAQALSQYMTESAIALGGFSSGAMLGFILLGPCTDQTDMLTLAVAPDARGKGYAKALTRAAETRAADKGCELIFLEVAQDNHAAAGLYKSCGYIPIGTRKNYYKREHGRVSALTMRKNLKP